MRLALTEAVRSVRFQAVSTASSVIKAVIRRFMLAGRFPSTRFVMGATTGREIPVLMCLWNRPGRVIDVLKQLDRQDCADGVNLYLWNNNRKDHSTYLKLLRSFTGDGNLRSISIVRSPFNLGSIARFYWARKLAMSNQVGPLIVIDDDEDLTDDFISICVRMYSPTTVHGFWAWVTGKTYWDRTPAEVGGRVDHVGPGGMVCNIELFKDAGFFTEMPLRFWLLDDVWFSYFAKRSGQQLAKLPVDIRFVLPETNQHHTQGPMKDDFYRFLYRT